MSVTHRLTWCWAPSGVIRHWWRPPAAVSLDGLPLAPAGGREGSGGCQIWLLFPPHGPDDDARAINRPFS